MASKDSLKSSSSTQTEEEQKKKEKEKIRQRWLSIERNRKKREPYEVKEISGWMHFGPFIGLLVAVIAGLMIKFSETNDTEALWWVVGIAAMPLILLGLTSDIDENWKASIAAKEEIEKENKSRGIHDGNSDLLYSDFSGSERTLNGFKYKYDCIYFDGGVSYWFYKITKFVMGLSTVGFIVLAAILLFMWLGSVSIAPTTIIIILLIMILLKR
jgi:hypothetical protein